MGMFILIAVWFRYGTGRAADTAGLNLGAVGIATNKRNGKIPAGENEEVIGGEGLEGMYVTQQGKSCLVSICRVLLS